MIMVVGESDQGYVCYIFTAYFIILVLFSGTIIKADTDTLDVGTAIDKEILLELKSFSEYYNKVNRGKYAEWNKSSSDPCNWAGISCNQTTRRVIRIDLSSSSLNGEIFTNFSGLTELSYLDLSENTLSGQIPSDLIKCRNLKYLNLSHNVLSGELNLAGFTSLEVLDLSVNKIWGGIQFTFPAICNSLTVLNISANNFSGTVDGCFDKCLKLEHVDLSANHFSGKIWSDFARVKEFIAGENKFSGAILTSTFGNDCALEMLDLSENWFTGEFPSEISNCKNLTHLILGGNGFGGRIHEDFGLISSLKVLILGGNKFTKEIPESLLSCRNLLLLDLSNNSLGSEIPTILGKFIQLEVLALHSNSFTHGLNSSGILRLPNLSRLDLSFNNFSGPLPLDISKMMSLQLLDIAYNKFSGKIPHEYGNLTQIQALDLSFNRLTGSIPPTFGKLTSLLWLMLANNSLTGEIPPELGNCSSLLWLNLANNGLNGKFPVELTNIGSNPMPTFLSNRRAKMVMGSGECLNMRRWIPADYPPYSFAYTLLTRKSCRIMWNKILKGYGLLPICPSGANSPTPRFSGYLQLTGNQLTGAVPHQVGQMRNFSIFHFGDNKFSGSLPPDVGNLPLYVLNVSRNNFSGLIPKQIGNMQCLQFLDLSLNNFSGAFPKSLVKLSQLSKFNVSYNPYLSGTVPSTGQFTTFDKDSFLGDPLLVLPPFLNNSVNPSPKEPGSDHKKRAKTTKLATYLVFIVLVFIISIVGVVSILLYTYIKPPSSNRSKHVSKHSKFLHDCDSSSTSSSPWISDVIKVINLDKQVFTYTDILQATRNFSDDRVIGRGGFGTVYNGVLPDGRQVAIKKQQRIGTEGEREFQSEMEVLSQQRINWPHPNLVNLYGWCLDGADKILVYEYMAGGSLEEVICDRTRLKWKARVEIAIDVARALVYLHHECYPPIVHRDVKASNVLLDKNGKARVTDFGLARVVDAGHTHVTTTVAGTVGYVAPEYGHTWQATTKGDVYSFGVLALELATGKRAVDGEDECLLERTRRVMEENEQLGLDQLVMVDENKEGITEMSELFRIGIRCTAETPQARPNMKEVLSMLVKILGYEGEFCSDSPSFPTIVCQV